MTSCRIALHISIPAMLLILVIGLQGCSWNKSDRQSVLVIAVESLGFNLVPCGLVQNRSNPSQGFKTFCEESVRFTHAYTPSVMSQSALASLLTARFPFEHNVWHNGEQYLSSAVETVAEAAIEKGFRTSFFSGGAPIFRKSGLHQGFEIFEDNIPVNLRKMYRSVKNNFQMFQSWLQKEVGDDPFFSVVFVPDLQFPDETTRTEFDEIRDKSFASQLLEVDESIQSLINHLKSKNRWDNTNVILVGLNGHNKYERPKEIPPYSLFGDNTQVALFIKPARKRRDLGIEWKIDRNVSLVDVGATLYDLIGASIPYPRGRKLEITSLKSVLERPNVNWSEDRLIIIETGWPQWRGVGGSRFAIRKNQYLFMYDKKVQIFNTLLDRQELTPLSANDPLWRSLYLEIERFLIDQGFLRWTHVPSSFIDKLRLASLLFRGVKLEARNEKQLKHLSLKRTWDQQVWGWRAIFALNQKNWEELYSLGKDAGKSIWSYVAAKNLEKEFNPSFSGCEVYLLKLKNYSRPSPQECDDSMFLTLLSWVHSKDKKVELQLQEKFLRTYIYQRIDQRILKSSFVNYLNWDVDHEQLQEPHLVDLFLSLPENRKYASIVESRLSREN